MKKNNFYIIAIATMILFGSFSLQAQEPGTAAYQAAKETGQLIQTAQVSTPLGSIPTIVPDNGNREAGLYIPYDDSFTRAMTPNDDSSSDLIPLPFTFCFYGTEQNSLYINNNGNVSFNHTYSTYSPTGFPSNEYNMIAAFWADVDTRSCGNVYYRIDENSNRIIIIWQEVGYYSHHCDKLNTFQLILTDGSDPLIGIGQNVAFAYDDMSWTTGDASGGSGGFGGYPATVGVNKGDGTTYALVGRFDHPGTDYDGPGGQVDGIDFLDMQRFTFDACGITNIPPVPVGFPSTPTTLDIGDNWSESVSFIAPEIDQTVTTVVSAPTLPTLQAIIVNGNQSTINLSLTPTIANLGTHTIQFTANDDFTPNGVTTQYIELIIETQSPPLFAVTPTSKDFGIVDVGETSSPQTFTISNIGSGTLKISGVVKSGTNTDQFLLTDLNTYPIDLTNGESITVVVAFKPTSIGHKTASLVISDDQEGGDHTVALTGNGIDKDCRAFNVQTQTCFSTAQNAIDAASFGDEIEVYYNPLDVLLINKKLHLHYIFNRP